MLTDERIKTIKKWTHKGLVNLQLWLEEHDPDVNLIYRKDWWERNVFIRDTLLREVFGCKYKIIGTHYSKSIECPVILVKYKKVEIILQYNFYDWQIMVNSKEAIKLNNLDLYHAAGDYFYYQGIPEEYEFKKYSNTNNKQFAIDIVDNLMYVYAFMLMLKIAIDTATNKKVVEEYQDNCKVFECHDFIVYSYIYSDGKKYYSLWITHREKGIGKTYSPTTAYFNTLEDAKNFAVEYYGLSLD